MSKKQKYGKDYCCVKGCPSKENKSEKLSFYRLPKANKGQVSRVNLFGKIEKVDRLKEWLKVLKIKQPHDRMRVCSLHFKDTDRYHHEVSSIRGNLLKTSVPSLNLPIDTREKKKEERDEARLERLIHRQLAKHSMNPKVPFSSNTVENKDQAMNVNEEQFVVNLEVLRDEPAVNQEQFLVNDKHCDKEHDVTDNLENDEHGDDCIVNDDFVNDPIVALINKRKENVNDKSTYKFSCTLDNDEKMCAATGVATIKLMDTIIEMIKTVYDENLENKNYTTRDKVILTYMKLKHNLSYRLLGIIFNVNAQICQKFFIEMVHILDRILFPVVTWPSREVIPKNVPMCFEGFEDTRVVLDCTEIFIQQSQKLCCQLKTYSHYKGAQTVKFMIGVSPAGLITFISSAYGGRASDTAIFSQSKLINLLEPCDGVMVDRSFLIDELCHENRWKLIRPPFLQDKKQFAESESILTSKIAAARVHCERVNQRIKAWAIGGSKMPASLVSLSDEIMTILCGTVNLSNPLLSDDKFMKI